MARVEQMNRLRDLDFTTRFVVDIAGHPIEVELADGIDDVIFRGLQTALFPVWLSADEAEATLELRRGSPPPPEPVPVKQSTDSFELRELGPGSIQITSDAGIATWRDGHGTIHMADEATTYQTLEYVEIMLVHAASELDTLPIHAGLVGDDNSMLLLLGTNGIGKSSVVGAAVEAGMTTAGDDITLLRISESEARCAGFPKTPLVPTNVLSDADETKSDGRGRISLRPDEFRTGWHRVGAIAVLEQGEQADTKLGEVTAMEVVTSLIKATFYGFGGSEQAQRTLDSMQTIAAIPRVRLSLGANERTRAATTAAAVRSILESLG